MKKLIILIFFLPVTGSSQQNVWTKKASFFIEIERAVSFSIGDYGYLGTGQDSADLMHNEFWKYDPALDAWSQVATMPAVGRRNAIAFVVNNKAYVGTGCDAAESLIGNNLKDIWEYDPATNGWLQKADYPGAFNNGIYFATAFACDSKGYVCGGKIGPSNYTNQLWEYKPSTNQWLQRANFPGGTRYQLASLVIDDIAYVGLGTDENYYMDDWWQYHPGLNTWTVRGDFPGVDRASVSTFTIGPRGFVMFGSDGGFLEDVWEYNSWNDSWYIRAPFPGGDRRNAISFAINGKGYAGTGKGSAGIRRNFYEYVPLTPTGEEEKETNVEVRVFPNPATDYINVTCTGCKETGTWNVFSLDGKTMLCGNALLEKFSIPASALPAGVYVLEVLSVNKEIHFKQRVIIEK